MEADAQNNTIGGTSSRARNLISGNNANGVGIHDSGSSGNVVLNNYIGVDVTGNNPLGNGLAGVKIREGAEGNFIGQPGYGNIICDNNDAGIWIENSSRNFFFGNFIGTNANGSPDLGNHATGVFVFGVGEEMSIGGANAGEGNTIAYNAQSGVALMSNAGSGVKIWSNSIFKNGDIGIDLGFDGWTQNDDGDGDTGPNGRQNYPVLETALSGNLFVSGSLNSTPNTTFRIEFFESDTCDPSGYGEGKAYLNAIAVNTDSSGNATFSVQLNNQTANGKYISATASAPDNSTSEFSNCIMAQPPTGVLAVTPESFSSTVEIGKSTNATLSISNTGTASTNWTISKTATWLSVNPETQNIAPGSTDAVILTLDATALGEGIYSDTLTITSSDTGQPAIKVPVDLTVQKIPNIVMSPTSFTFTAPEGGQDSKNLTVKNTGSATLTFSVNWDFQSPWLGATNNSGSLAPGDSTTVTLTANAVSLTAGVYNGDFFTTSNDPDEANVIIPSVFTVTGAGPQIAVSPDSITATPAAGQTSHKQLLIKNIGNANLSWTITKSSAWLSPSAPSGNVTAGGQFSLNLTLSQTGLSAGVYRDTLRIASNDTDTPVLNVPVKLTVPGEGSGPQITVSQNSLVSTLDSGDTATHHVAIGNAGDAELQWSINWATGWLDAAPASGSTPPGGSEDITVTIDAAGLSGGEYIDSLLVNSTDPDNPVKKVNVSLTVNTYLPKINVEQDNLVSTLVPGDSAMHVVVIANQGSGDLNWSIVNHASWIHISRAAGQTLPGGSDSVKVMLYAASLAPGNYPDSLFVMSNDLSKPEVRIQINLTVQNTTSVQDRNATPDDFSLKQNYPNPFNPSTIIQYSLPEAARINLSIFDVSGRRVRTLVQTDKPAGRYEAIWYGKDQHGLPVSTGMYFYMLSGKSKTGKVFRLTQKMVLLK